MISCNNLYIVEKLFISRDKRFYESQKLFV